MAVFDRELAVPFPVGWFVDAVDVDVTALTQRDHVLDAIVRVVAVDVVQRKFVLDSGPRISFKPFLWGSTADHTRVAPAVEDCLFEVCRFHYSVY
jgi:hypothetical protein